MAGEKEDVININDHEPASLKVTNETKTPKRPKPNGTASSKIPKRWTIVLIVIGIFLMIIIPIAVTLQTPVVDVVGVDIQTSGTGASRTHKTLATVEVYNPNFAGITVLRIEGKFYVNGQYCGDFLRDESVDIGARGTTAFDVEVHVNNAFIVKWNSNNPVRVVGTVKVQGPLSSWDVPFDETRDVHVP